MTTKKSSKRAVKKAAKKPASGKSGKAKSKTSGSKKKKTAVNFKVRIDPQPAKPLGEYVPVGGMKIQCKGFERHWVTKNAVK